MSNLKGSCIYCGGSGLTKEHIFPAWLKPHLSQPASHMEVGVQILAGKGEEETQSHRLTGSPLSRKIRAVCGRCNSGWMSDLQSEAKPILLPMILGTRVELDTNAQRVISRWIAMTMMTAQYITLKPLGYKERFGVEMTAASPQEHRDFVRTNCSAPPGWIIEIGRAPMQSFHPLVTHNFAFPTPELLERHRRGENVAGKHPVNAHSTTILLGHLFMHAIACPWQQLLETWQFPTRLNYRLLRVWPEGRETATWPRGFDIETNHAAAIADGFAEHIARINGYPNR